jgi:c-di-GMP-binding flagellar brake protein YcgR
MQERRQFVRIKARLYIAYKGLDSAQSVEGHCWSRDISAGGIGLLIKDRVEFGTMMEVRIGLHDNLKPLIANVKVFWQVESPKPAEDGSKCYRTGVIFANLAQDEKNRLDNFIDNFIKGNVKGVQENKD